MSIISVRAREILDSRGNPTVEAEVLLEDGSMARAAVPSGASTGSLEAFELRDNDQKRFHGKGVLKAVQAVNGEIADAITGMKSEEQVNIDNVLIELDGTENKSRLGANAILAVSMANAKAAAKSFNMQLYQYLGGVYSHIMPVPLMNIINGGMHADNLIDIQEFMIVPHSATSIRDAIRMGAEVFYSLKSELKKAGHNTNTGDEGGFAPNLKSAEEALDYVMKSIKSAGYEAGKDISIALDVAASEFYKDGKYLMQGTNTTYNSAELIKYYDGLISNFPIISIEDPMSEHDKVGWIEATEQLGGKVQLVGDDLFVTNSKILESCYAEKMANSILIKPNQIGTISETLRTVETAQKLGYTAVLSHRSGETEDTTIAHIAVATNCGQIKTGSLSRADRTAKYNELIRIEENLSNSATYPGLKAFTIKR